MITLEKLDRLGLDQVQIGNFAADEDVLDSLEGACEQGRQGWGVRREQGVMLALARTMRVHAHIASQADTAQRNLKGEQLAHGRTKKREETLKQSNGDLNVALLQEKAANRVLQKQIDALQAAEELDKPADS